RKTACPRRAVAGRAVKGWGMPFPTAKRTASKPPPLIGRSMPSRRRNWPPDHRGALQRGKRASTLLPPASRCDVGDSISPLRTSMAPSTTNEIRPLTDDEIARLEKALRQPIERPYLVQWVSRAIQAFVVIVTLPTLRERRDDLKEIAEQVRKWMATVEQCRSARLLPPVVDVRQLMISLRPFCRFAESMAQQLDQAVGPGHPRTNVALDAFLDPLIGIAKRAKVLPSIPSRALLDPIELPPGPPFFMFVREALDIAMEVIRS